jgi:hypothetical protein
MSWFGSALLESLCNPDTSATIELRIEKFRETRSVVVINCIDYLYGHTLLKLLNAERHRHAEGIDIVVIVQSFLKWLVPEYVAEIWTVDIPLSKAQYYYPALHMEIENQLVRFDTAYISRAYSHPKYFDIENFTRIKRHNIAAADFRITFIWREDRLWWENNRQDRPLWENNFTLKVLIKSGLARLLQNRQNRKIVHLFSELRNMMPQAKFTVAGLGCSTSFPDWIEDKRTESFSPESERYSCQIYSESRLVIGVHGSNMLLPSGHGGMTLDLRPADRWGNLAQDVLYQSLTGLDEDQRIVSWRYRYIPINSDMRTITSICNSMLNEFHRASKLFLNVPQES